MGLAYGLKHNSQLSLHSYCGTSCISGEKSADARAQTLLPQEDSLFSGQIPSTSASLQVVPVFQ